MNLTVTGGLYYRGARREVAHGDVVAEVFDTNAQIGGTLSPGGRHVTSSLVLKRCGK
jgi:hypothetical protein